MRALGNKEAIELIDSEKEVSYDYIHDHVAVVLRGDDEVLEKEFLISFINKYLEILLQLTSDTEHLEKIRYAIDNKVLKGYTLEMILVECRGVAIYE